MFAADPSALYPSLYISGSAMRCAICGHELHSATMPVVSTTMGDFVHISCADGESCRAYRWRTFRATTSATLALVLLDLALQSNLRETALLALLVLLAVGHVRLNERWWRVTLPMILRRARAVVR
jgi:hypothetical protein